MLAFCPHGAEGSRSYRLLFLGGDHVLLERRADQGGFQRNYGKA